MWYLTTLTKKPKPLKNMIDHSYLLLLARDVMTILLFWHILRFWVCFVHLCKTHIKIIQASFDHNPQIATYVKYNVKKYVSNTGYIELYWSILF